ncbi:dehydrogenase [Alishewanella aestuarii B11]|uniref:Dehydrogenase n=1 Tax=Alishewanella aestuarii B11 TaxID=1197174 RepID=J2IF17_9ALTE|nr:MULTISPECIES: SDR family oxidoreductase [Alishewanella]EJI85787.1 dehydrogenase [Alishewanella aestuarii B11]MCT8126424.1 SDR family oxidoreductase [Alishewanella sp. BS5-314]
MTISLQDKVIWITGASGGIGEALAKQFAAAGAKVVLSARRRTELERVQQSLPQPERHLTVPLDICDEHAQQQALDKIIHHYGRLDWLINNAGISQRALVMDTSSDTDRKIMEIDYFAQVALSRRVLSVMLKQGTGQLVFISSVAGLVGTQYRGSYSAAKAALHLWANSVRAELYNQGIRVAVVFPGFVKTAVSMNALTGSGEALGKMDDAQAKAMTADEFATATLKALRKGNSYIVIGGFKEKLAAFIARLSPELLYRLIRKSKVR